MRIQKVSQSHIDRWCRVIVGQQVFDVPVRLTGATMAA